MKTARRAGPKPKGPHGRPRVMTPVACSEILSRIADGESVRSICEDAHLPARRTVYNFLAQDSEFRTAYEAAKVAMAEKMADEILEIADDGRNDWVERKNSDGKPYQVVDHEHVTRSRLRVDTRKWLLSKLLPKVYGDKLSTELSGPRGGQVEVASVPDLEAIRRIAFLLAQGRAAAMRNGGDSNA